MSNAVDRQQGRLYEQVANRVADMINKGALKCGDRIPSVRRLSDQLSVAISTVLHVYHVSEDQRLIEARR